VSLYLYTGKFYVCIFSVAPSSFIEFSDLCELESIPESFDLTDLVSIGDDLVGGDDPDDPTNFIVYN
jgi:hypothetical protein